MTRILMLSVALLIGTTSSFAQQAERVGSIGIRTGLSTYYGELNDKLFPASTESVELFDNLDYATWSVDYETYIGNAWGIGLSYTNAEFSATDRSVDWDGVLLQNEINFNRSLNVNTKIQQLSLYGLWSGNDGKLFKENAFFSPFAKLGLGVMKFDPNGDLLSANGNPYRYNDGRVLEVEGSDLLIASALDGTYETELRELNTEGSSYGDFSLTAQGGIGFNFRFSDGFSMQLGTDVRYTFTDNLDNISGPFANFNSQLQNTANNPAGFDLNDTRGESGNDWYAFTYVGARFYFGNRADDFKSPVVILGELPLGDTAIAGQRLFTFEPPQPLIPLEFAPLPVSSNPSNPMFIQTVSMLPPAPQWQDTDGGAEVPSIEDEGREKIDIVGDDSISKEEIGMVNQEQTSVTNDTARPPKIVTTYPDWAKDDNIKISDSLSTAIENLNTELSIIEPTEAYTVKLDSLTDSARPAVSEVERAKTRQIDSLRNALAAMQLPVKKDSLVIQGRDTIYVERRVLAEARINEEAAVRKLEADIARLNKEVQDTEAYRKRLIEQEKNRLELLEERDRQIAKEAKRDDETQRKYDRGLLRNDAAESAAMLKMAADQAALRAEVATLSAQLAAMTIAMQNDTSSTVIIPAQPITQTPQQVQTQIASVDPVLVAELNALRMELAALRQSMVNRPVTQAAPPKAVPSSSTPIAQQVTTPNRSAEAEILGLLSQYGSTQVFFETGKASLSTAALNSLGGLANGAQRYPDRIFVSLTGFTDKTGSQAVNQALSQRRVDAVRNALINLGVAANQIRTEASGPDLNASDLASARRVEVVLKVQ